MSLILLIFYGATVCSVTYSVSYFDCNRICITCSCNNKNIEISPIIYAWKIEYFNITYKLMEIKSETSDSRKYSNFINHSKPV